MSGTSPRTRADSSGGGPQEQHGAQLPGPPLLEYSAGVGPAVDDEEGLAGGGRGGGGGGGV